MTAILKFERITTKIAFFLAIVFLCIAASFALYQVLTRFVLDNPSTWSETVIRSTMIWAIFLGVSAAYRDGAMISVEIIQTNLPKRLGLSLYIFANFLSLLFFAVLFWPYLALSALSKNSQLARLATSGNNKMGCFNDPA